MVALKFCNDLEIICNRIGKDIRIEFLESNLKK